MRLFVLLLAVKASGLAVRLNKLLPGLSRRKADAASADGGTDVAVSQQERSQVFPDARHWRRPSLRVRFRL